MLSANIPITPRNGNRDRDIRSMMGVGPKSTSMTLPKSSTDMFKFPIPRKSSEDLLPSEDFTGQDAEALLASVESNAPPEHQRIVISLLSDE